MTLEISLVGIRHCLASSDTHTVYKTMETVFHEIKDEIEVSFYREDHILQIHS